MKVGVLTFHHVYNWGAILQAYALARVLQEDGHAAEIIDYRPEGATRIYEHHIRSARPRIAHRLQAWRMNHFIRYRLPLGGKRYNALKPVHGLGSHYDAIVTGSDQVWHFTDNSFRPYDPALYLDFVADADCKRISYAASFGDMKCLGGRRGEIGEHLSRYHAISVRDGNSQRLVREACGAPAEVVLDPTFLTDLPQRAASRRRRRGGRPAKYILLYARLTWPQECEIREYARQAGLPIVAAVFPSGIASVNRVAAGSDEFLDLIRDATLVVTSAFHGTALAVKYGRDVVAYPEAGKRTKISDLLGRLGMSDRIVLGDESGGEPFADIARRPVDYDSVHRTLDGHRDASRRFLRDALHGGHGNDAAGSGQAPRAARVDAALQLSH